MKIIASAVIVALMSSFLVVGLESENASALKDRRLMPSAGSHTSPKRAGASDVAADGASSFVGGSSTSDVTTGRSRPSAVVGQPEPSTASDVTSRGRSNPARSDNVIYETDAAVMATRSSVAKSVINRNSQKAAAAGAESPAPDAQPSRLSQLSKHEREQLLSNLEASFLKIVGLRSRPRPGAHVTIPQYMRELYERHVQSHRGKAKPPTYASTLHNSNTIRSFFHTEDDDKHPENVVRLKFNITSFPGHEVLQAAELRLYREAVGGQRADNGTLGKLLRERHRIDVYQILDGRTRYPDESGTLTRLIDTRLVDPSRSGWESFDVTPALAAWRSGSSHGRLEVRFSRQNGDPSPLRHVRLKRSAEPIRKAGRSGDGDGDDGGDGDGDGDPDWEAHKPLLVAYSQDPAGKVHQRDRRNKRNTDRKRGRRKRSKKNRGKRRKDRPRKDRDYKRDCRRRPLYVDFHDVGWTDWIVAPPGYDAFYCFGECPFHMSDHFNTTNHAVVQQFVHSVDPQAVPKPCCVPTELGQLALLYIDEQGKVVLKNYDEMVVEACGCR